MTPRTYGRARDLFARARRLPRDGRTAWLRRNCDERATLLAEVRALLAQDENGARSFLRTPPACAARDGQPDELGLGGYSLLRTLGAGSTCVLHLVRQRRPVRRTCLIKMVKGDADDPRARARLNAEVRALAATDHPNVVTLLDAGAAPDGRPFLAMRHVVGIGIRRFCDAHAWPLRRRLELFLDACEAVRHVHERGVVHRDLCPDNLLVALHGRTPHLTLVGFGWSVLMSDLFTEDDARRTEPTRYAPPELAACHGRSGAADPRGDVYSLGVILGELLPPRVPRAARARLRAAVRRATQEDPSRRYQTVDQLAEDVQACLAAQSPCRAAVVTGMALAVMLVGWAVVSRLFG